MKVSFVKKPIVLCLAAFLWTAAVAHDDEKSTMAHDDEKSTMLHDLLLNENEEVSRVDKNAYLRRSSAMTNKDMHARHLLSIADPENRCEWFTIDFSAAGNLTELHHGDYVQNEWLDTQGVKVEASSDEHSGYTPNGMARIFDTSMNDTRDADLESPNHKCGGTGIGRGGEPGNPGENCVPQGNVLIIQESNKTAPDNNQDGGMISFTFVTPTDQPMIIGLMDIEEKRDGDVFFEIYRTGASVPIRQDIFGLGDNSIQEETISHVDVERVTLVLAGPGAITFLSFCSPLSIQPTLSPPPPAPLPTQGPVQPVTNNCGEAKTTYKNIAFELCVVRTFFACGELKKVVVFYTETNGKSTDWLTPVDVDEDGKDESPREVAQHLAAWTQRVWQTFANWGFPDPMGLSEFNVLLHDIGGGTVGLCCRQLSNGRIAFELGIPLMYGRFRGGIGYTNLQWIAHEFAHAVDYYTGYAPPSFNEGIPQLIQDLIDHRIDERKPVSHYLVRVNEYLANQTQLSFLSSQVKYTGALFWKYFTEQVGTPTIPSAEPAYGIDAIRLLLEEMEKQSTGTAMAFVEKVVKSRDPHKRNLEDFWCDFNTANYIKDLKTGTISPKFQYVDAAQTPYAASVPLDHSGLLRYKPGDWGDATVNAWSARYYRPQPIFETGDPTIQWLHYNITPASSQDRVGVTVIFISPSSRRLFGMFRYISNQTIYEVVPVRPDLELIFVISGLSTSSDYSYQFRLTLEKDRNPFD